MSPRAVNDRPYTFDNFIFVFFIAGRPKDADPYNVWQILFKDKIIIKIKFREASGDLSGIFQNSLEFC